MATTKALNPAGPIPGPQHITASPHDPSLLAHRQGEQAEAQRFNEQHYTVKDGILQGHLIHPLIQPTAAWTAVADLGCRTGVWLNDVAKTHFAGPSGSGPRLIGFDTNPTRFAQTLEPGVELVHQDIAETFEDKYHGQFDLVNIRVVVFALPAEGVQRMVRNAVQLLKPGGYLQWGESEPRLWQPAPASPGLVRALELLNVERTERQLVDYMPHFMIESVLKASPATPTASAQPPPLQILQFEFFPGGITPANLATLPAKDTAVSRNILAALKLLLQASVVRLQTASSDQAGAVAEISRVQAEIDEALSTGAVHLGGMFPFIVVKRSD